MRLFSLIGAMTVAFSAMAAAPPPPLRNYIARAQLDKARLAEDVARDVDRKPAEMVRFAGIWPGGVVVDLVPGKGYFTRIFAKVVGPNGHVYAYYPTEIDSMLKEREPSVTAVTNDTTNYPAASLIHAPLAKFTVPKAPDVVWTAQNYHDFHDKLFGPVDVAAVNKAIYDALKPGGIYVVVDHAAAAGSGLRDTETLHRIDPETVKKEVTAVGFEFVAEYDRMRNPADPHTKNVFDPSIRGKTDQFAFKFRKPLK